jgi:hypothetical protein
MELSRRAVDMVIARGRRCRCTEVLSSSRGLRRAGRAPRRPGPSTATSSLTTCLTSPTAARRPAPQAARCGLAKKTLTPSQGGDALGADPAGVVIGTPYDMSPEQGPRPAPRPRPVLYSWGVAFGAAQPASCPSSAATPLRSSRCTSTRPAQHARFSSAACRPPSRAVLRIATKSPGDRHLRRGGAPAASSSAFANRLQSKHAHGGHADARAETRGGAVGCFAPASRPPAPSLRPVRPPRPPPSWSWRRRGPQAGVRQGRPPRPARMVQTGAGGRAAQGAGHRRPAVKARTPLRLRRGRRPRRPSSWSPGHSGESASATRCRQRRVERGLVKMPATRPWAVANTRALAAAAGRCDARGLRRSRGGRPDLRSRAPPLVVPAAAQGACAARLRAARPGAEGAGGAARARARPAAAAGGGAQGRRAHARGGQGRAAQGGPQEAQARTDPEEAGGRRRLSPRPAGAHTTRDEQAREPERQDGAAQRKGCATGPPPARRTPPAGSASASWGRWSSATGRASVRRPAPAGAGLRLWGSSPP